MQDIVFDGTGKAHVLKISDKTIMDWQEEFLQMNVYLLKKLYQDYIRIAQKKENNEYLTDQEHDMLFMEMPTARWWVLIDMIEGADPKSKIGHLRRELVTDRLYGKARQALDLTSTLKTPETPLIDGAKVTLEDAQKTYQDMLK